MHIMLFGGTFDPLNYFHIKIAKRAFEKFKPDSFRFVPTHETKYYDQESQKRPTAPEVRLEMLRRGLPSWAEISTLEIDHRTSGRTIELVEVLRTDKRYREHTYSWVMGSDQRIFEFTRANDVIGFFDFFAVFPRSEYPIGDYIDGSKFRLIQEHPLPNDEVDSTRLREWLRLGIPVDRVIEPYGKTLRDFLPEGVLEYIQEHNPYGPGLQGGPEVR